MKIEELIGPRTTWLADIDSPVQHDGDGIYVERSRVAAPLEHANLVSSFVSEGVHWPVLDIDVPYGIEEQYAVRYALGIDNSVPVITVPSSTPGHCHLYVQGPVSEAMLLTALCVLVEREIIQPGYQSVSQYRCATFVRLPHVRKPATISG